MMEGLRWGDRAGFSAGVGVRRRRARVTMGTCRGDAWVALTGRAMATSAAAFGQAMTTKTAPRPAALRPLRRRNLSEEIAAILAEQIARGHLKPGARLRSEREMSEAFAVSRSSVREAIKSLESRGLVEGRQGGGTFVRSQGLEMLVQVPAGPVSVSEAEVQYLYEVRAMLDPGIARLAAQRATAADVAALRRLLERHQRHAAAGRY